MHRFFDFLMLGLVVAAIFVMVRPRSQGPILVEKVANGIKDFATAITGGGGW